MPCLCKLFTACEKYKEYLSYFVFAYTYVSDLRVLCSDIRPHDSWCEFRYSEHQVYILYLLQKNGSLKYIMS